VAESTAQIVDRREGYHTDEQVVGYYNTGDRMNIGARLVHSGRLLALLFGSAMFVIPGLGPILVAGPLVAWIVAGWKVR